MQGRKRNNMFSLIRFSYWQACWGRAADMNGDCYPDLFVGGRVIPGRYPETPQSYLLINDGNGHFTDQTQQISSQLRYMGIITDAAWVDMNGDKKPDLIV